MERMSIERRLLLKAATGAAFGLINGASLADILQAGSVPDAGSPGRDGLAAAQSRLADGLLRVLADQSKAGGGNLIVSPASLASILSFVDLGASNVMRAAIHQTLGFKRANRRRMEQDLSALRDSVSAITRSGTDGPITLANLLAFDLSTRPRQLALMGLSGAGADVLVDQLSDATVVERINGWVRQKTHDLIPSIIEEPPEDLSLAAINALYFRDRWKTPFDPARTKSMPFQMLSGWPVDVDMMHAPDAKFGFRQDERFVAAELAYAHDNFKLVAVTTKTGLAQVSEFSTVSAWLGGEGFATVGGEIGMPKMSLAATRELLRPLDTLGLAGARKMPDALNGFSAMPLIIGRVVQKLDLRLDEDGTEAAAVTAAMATRSLGTRDHIRLIFDKPFVFALRDQRTGFILFAGYVAAPATPNKT